MSKYTAFLDSPDPAVLDYIVRFFSQQLLYIETEAAAKQLYNMVTGPHKFLAQN